MIKKFNNNNCDYLPDCMLRLDGEKEATGEAANIPDTGDECFVVIILRNEIAMAVRDQPPYERKS